MPYPPANNSELAAPENIENVSLSATESEMDGLRLMNSVKSADGSQSSLRKDLGNLCDTTAGLVRRTRDHEDVVRQNPDCKF